MARSWTGWKRSATSNTRPFEGNQGGTMTDKTVKKIWFITGASRGMGVDFAKTALATGHAVVATGRDTGAVAKAVGKSGDLLVVMLGVTIRTHSEGAVR